MRGKSIDREAVQNFCARLGIDYDVEAQNNALREKLLHFLSRNAKSLERLAERNAVTLYNLSINDLMPSPLKHRISMYGSRNTPAVSAREERIREITKAFHKEVGALTQSECHQVYALETCGSGAVESLLILSDLHRQTNGFKTLVGEMLSPAEQEALIERMAGAVRTDRTMQQKLLGMFPAHTP
jgi:hypothetical protein